MDKMRWRVTSFLNRSAAFNHRHRRLEAEVALQYSVLKPAIHVCLRHGTVSIMFDDIRAGERRLPAIVTYFMGLIMLTGFVLLAYSSVKNSATCSSVSLWPVGGLLQLEARSEGSLSMQQANAQTQEHGIEPSPFYVPPSASVLREMANSLKPVTDKVGASWLPAQPNYQHTYDALYSKYFETNNQRLRKLKVLEIGLGCNMAYGPGASAPLWRSYLPNSELWFAEYDQNCVRRYADKIQQLGMRVVTGDQADNATLARWLAETGGGFHVIIDDGGHRNDQIYNSFANLFHNALKPGGVYFIEDLQMSRTAYYRGPAGAPIMRQVITDWVESILAATTFASASNLTNAEVMKATTATYRRYQDIHQRAGDASYLPVWRLPAGVKMIDCAAEMCAIVKCTTDDSLCPNGLGRQPMAV